MAFFFLSLSFSLSLFFTLCFPRYDPVHFMVPDGSYASEPDGSARIREFREMVVHLNKIGLRVVLDVVGQRSVEVSASLPRSPTHCCTVFFFLL